MSMVMMGAPTGTVSPSSACSAATTPANGDGSSTAALAVSTSTMVSLTSTVSPTATVHLRMSPSVRPSPRSGSLNCWIDTVAQYSMILSTASRMRSRLGSQSSSSRLGG